ncbi:aldehyde dehydrogenase family protein, partial [Mycobacterium interjectum]|uniref:aldehyde dehydrogenase family protein n=1 Tax=Mycobacterium interjectum TaxID=33895 RepID=UPI0021F32737
MTKVINVLDPRTGDKVSQVPITEPADCDEAVRRAADAAPGWARTPSAERAAA